ncbi:glucose-6-phosphate isomerase [Candidatus Micrarchaeota archaeon]|nr:MAG: glucose-6-phosphate isomerase [Candidatus Micrarchaeota archaeon]
MEVFGKSFEIEGLKLSLELDYSSRMPEDAIGFYMDDEALRKERQPLYLMYRSIERLNSDAKRIADKHDLTLNLTLLRPGFVGKEYIRTIGHYHINVPGTNDSYPEIYEVLSGEGAFLLQHRNMKIFKFVKIKKGDKVFIAPNYGHILVNTGKEALLTLDINARESMQHDYETVKKRHGFCYYLIKGEKFIKNPNYDFFPEINKIRPKQMLSDKQLDQIFLEKPEFFEKLLKNKIHFS